MLKDVSLTLKAGRAYAVVGASGKSTLLGLLDGMLSGYRGHIRADGIELSDIRREFPAAKTDERFPAANASASLSRAACSIGPLC